MKVVIFGSTGMLGQAIYRYFRELNDDVYGVARNNADFNVDVSDDKKVKGLINNIKPDVVINTIGIVNIEKCEENHYLAYKINARFVSILTEVCQEVNCYFIQISTDHFYIGEGKKKHKEKDKIVLVNEYARTKYAGEQFALTYKQCLVVRTNIVGYRNRVGTNTFVEWVLSEFKTKKCIIAFNDFYTSSIDVYNFAKILRDLIEKRATGVFNLASSEVASKLEFIELMSKKFNSSIKIIESSLKNHTGIIRANSLGLSTLKIEKFLGYKLPTQAEVVNSLKENYWEVVK